MCRCTVKNHNLNVYGGMVHWRGFGHDFKTHLLEVLLNPWPCAAFGLSNSSQVY